MSKNLYINQTLNECRAALVENEKVLEFLIDRRENKFGYPPSVGNIYKGKVVKILPGIQSAFVNIGYPKSAFLYVNEAYIPSPKDQQYEFSTLSETDGTRFRPKSPIESFLKTGDEILVQISREPIGTKGPRLTRHISLPGRYLVFMPFTRHIGVSHRILDPQEQERLKTDLEEICPLGQGLVARTFAQGRNLRTLKTELEMLLKTWNDLQHTFKTAQAPDICYKNLNFIERVLRDTAYDDVDAIYVDDRNNQKKIESFSENFLPPLREKCRLYKGDTPLFEKFGIDPEIERGLADKVSLPSGGSLNIDQTEALVSIDVNTEKFVGRKSIDKTILKTNLEAACEIAYQIRLRNCGGIIIIDFIDMENKEHQEQVYQTLTKALSKDSAKICVMPISGPGLVEMTRKRTRDTLSRIICTPCPYCKGSGKTKSTLSVSYELMRKLTKTLKKDREHQPIHIYAHPKVIARLCDDEVNMIEPLKEAYQRPLIVHPKKSYHIERYNILSQEME